MSDSLSAESIRLRAHGGDEIEAYLTRPAGTSRRGGVVHIHHLPGYDRASKEMTRRFAELGYDAICPNLFWREAPGAAPDDAAAAFFAVDRPSYRVAAANDGWQRIAAFFAEHLR